MRLAFISPFGLSPKATLSHRLLPLAQTLKNKGHEVIIAIPPYTNPEASGRSEFQAGVRLINITLPGPHTKNFGVGVNSLRIGLRLAGVVKDFNPDKIYIFKPKGYSALAGMILWLSRKKYPFILDIDDLESDRDMERRMGYTWWMRIFFRYQEKWLLKRAEAVTVASQYLRRYYGQQVGTEKIYYLPNGPVSVGGLGGAEDLKKKLGLQGKRIVLLYTRFTECPLKDIIDFVRLFSDRCPEGVLLVIGEGYHREREILAGELEKRDLADFVCFTGWVKREELKDYLSLGEAAIYPFEDTAFNQAKCSAKLIELMDMGIPVAASPVGEVLTYIRDDESGLLARDTGEMVEKVAGLLEDREKARRIGQGARRFLYDNFSWEKSGHELLSFRLHERKN